jgi:hypothetical protein
MHNAGFYIVALFLFLLVLEVRFQIRALRKQLVKMKARVDAMQAEDYRALMRSLKKDGPDFRMQGPSPAPSEGSAGTKLRSPKIVRSGA